MATTDTAIVLVFASIFIILGAVLPFLETAYGDRPVNQSIDDFADPLEDLQNKTNLNAWDVIKSIVSMLFWSANLNFWFQLIIIEPMRVVMYFALARAILQ